MGTHTTLTARIVNPQIKRDKQLLSTKDTGVEPLKLNFTRIDFSDYLPRLKHGKFVFHNEN